jgi:UDP-N-acetylmuramate dehydrogenase
MEVQTGIPLKQYTTMQLGGLARFMVTVTTPTELAEVTARAKQQNLSTFVLGGGSNVIVTDTGFDGMVILNRIPGFEILSDDGLNVTVKIGAGEDWDSVVDRAVKMQLSGIEALSAIPGTAGATPVQNVGAYGQEIANTLTELETYDSKDQRFVILQNADCGFAYRYSIFKSLEDRRYIITSITLSLSRTVPKPPFYDSLQKYLDTHAITYITPQVIRDAVIAIRKEKLPSPILQPNTGSFFKNPTIEQWLLDDLRKQYDDIPSYPMADGMVKVPAGWLIEHAELKGYAAHGMKIYEKNALVVINEAATSYDDLATFREEIVTKVRDQFRITLEQEPELLG